MNYYRITEVSKCSAWHPDWPNLVGAVIAATPGSVSDSILAKGFKSISGMFVKVPPQTGSHAILREKEPIIQRAVKLHKLSPSERRKIDETRRRAA